ncbi:MAG: phosphomannomutase/phosphoglucomutase [Ruminococcaceae bacterium]|nr:phosphomannomutase/phosphoglucomutase [Oscillospiraceae bacterium]
MEYMFLKSGTDVRGIASDLGGKAVELTDKAVYDISAAFAVWCVNKFSRPSNELRIALGHDSRITADRISAQVKRALINAGITVLDCGLASTPAMFMTTVDLHTDAAIQITASHHPLDRNGLKFFIGEGGLEGSDISEILTLASNEEECISENSGAVEKFDYMTDYAARLRDMIIREVGKGDKPLKNYHIVVDAGNGVGGFYANNVLAPLGADISGSQFLEPDGMFPNHIPNPENKQAIESICEAVKKSNADFGVIFDTDVDRAGCVDGDGNEINRNRLIAIAAYIALGGKKGGTIVTDSVTSDGLKKYINEDLGGVHYRYRRGYKNVINKAIELCEQGIDCPLAIETSGHAALRENYFLDDGAYLATKIIIELAKGTDIKQLLSTMEMPAEEEEHRFNIKSTDFRAYGENVIVSLEKFADEKADYVIADDNREGIRVSTPNGWFLLRLSVHDPVMPMNFESNKIGGIAVMKQEVKEFFENFSELEIPKGF